MENEIQPGLDGDFQQELDKLEACGNLRVLPETCSDGKWIEAGGRRMLNLSSNDYLGLASDKALREEFLRTVKERDLCFSSSSSRLLTGNFPAYRELESLLASLFGECTGVQQRVSHEYGNSSGGDRCKHADFSRQISACKSD